MTRPIAAVFAVCGFAAAVCVPRNVNAADLTIKKNVHLGNLLHGAPVTAEQLEGSVVFVEEWGIH